MWWRWDGSWVQMKGMAMGPIAAAKASFGDPLCPPRGVRTDIRRQWVRCQTQIQS